MNEDEELRRQAETVERRDWKVMLRTKVWEAPSGPPRITKFENRFHIDHSHNLTLPKMIHLYPL